MSIKQTLQQAITHHKLYELQQAEELYRAILTDEPKHPDANHNLGTLLKQNNQLDSALGFFKIALEANPNQSQFWISYIDTLIHLRQLDLARNILEVGQSKGLKGDMINQLAERLNSQLEKAKSTNPTPIKTIKPERLLARAKSHTKKGEIEAARRLYSTVLKTYPQNQQAKKGLKSLQQGTVTKKNQLGPPQTQIDTIIAFYSQGQLKEALDTIEILTKDYPNEALLFNIKGACFQALSKLNAAVKCYEQAITIRLDYFEAHNNLGNTLQELGHLDAAVKSYEKALAITPNYAEVHNNLGNTLQEIGQLDAAVKSYEKALAIKPDYAEAHSNLGNTLQKLDQLDEAVKSFEKALTITPDYAEAYSNLGNTLKDLEKLDAAAKCYEKALAIKPDYADAHNNLGATQIDLGQLDEAVKSYKKSLELNPKNHSARHQLNSLLGRNSQSAPKEYVENLFNKYANKFEDSLVNKLEYTMPSLLRKAFLDSAFAKNNICRTIDLGCGTGLCGVEFKDLTETLIGVDISEKMISKAQEKNIYDELYVNDLISGLKELEGTFDLFISSDVFVYVGDLESLFKTIREHATKNSLFIFSTEDEDGDGVIPPFITEVKSRGLSHIQ